MIDNSQPLYCPHGRVIDWGEFGERCPRDFPLPPACEKCDEREQFRSSVRVFGRVFWREIIERPLLPLLDWLDRRLGG